jgi:hypothetical protein
LAKGNVARLAGRSRTSKAELDMVLRAAPATEDGKPQQASPRHLRIDCKPGKEATESFLAKAEEDRLKAQPYEIDPDGGNTCNNHN